MIALIIHAELGRTPADLSWCSDSVVRHGPKLLDAANRRCWGQKFKQEHKNCLLSSLLMPISWKSTTNFELWP